MLEHTEAILVAVGVGFDLWSAIWWLQNPSREMTVTVTLLLLFAILTGLFLAAILWRQQLQGNENEL